MSPTLCSHLTTAIRRVVVSLCTSPFCPRPPPAASLLFLKASAAPVHPRPPTGRASSSPCLSSTHTELLTSEVFPPPRRPFLLAVDATCICCPHTSSDSLCLWTEGFSRAGRVLSSRLLLTHHSLVMSTNVGGGCDALGRVPGTGLNTKTRPLLSGVSVLG